jgi:hypothetical protein
MNETERILGLTEDEAQTELDSVIALGLDAPRQEAQDGNHQA